MKDISIIGATSHLGVHLVDHLVGLGCNINASYRVSDRIPTAWKTNDLINCVRVDLNEEKPAFDFLRTERVIWLAHLDQGRFNEREAEVNLRPFKCFLRIAQDSPVRQITFISSGGSVYGEARKLPISENHPRDPISSYGKAKKAMEDALLEFARSSGVHVAVVRPGNIYGFEDPLRNSKGIVGAFLDSMSNRTPFTLIDEGRTVRDFIHVDDVCAAIATALLDEQKEKIWNAATGVPSKISHILDLIALSSPLARPEFIHRPNYSSDVQTNVLSIERITSESAWRPKVDIETGIDTAVKNWMNSVSLLPQTV